MAHKEEDLHHAEEEHQRHMDEEYAHQVALREDWERKQHEDFHHDADTDEHIGSEHVAADHDDDDHYGFDDLDAGFHHEPRREREEKSNKADKLSTPLILATAANMYLDTTVTKFL